MSSHASMAGLSLTTTQNGPGLQAQPSTQHPNPTKTTPMGLRVFFKTDEIAVERLPAHRVKQSRRKPLKAPLCANPWLSRLGMLTLAARATAQGSTNPSQAATIRSFTFARGQGTPSDLSNVVSELALLPGPLLDAMAARPAWTMLVCRDNVTDCDPTQTYTTTNKTDPYGRGGPNVSELTALFVAEKQVALIAASSLTGRDNLHFNGANHTTVPLLMAGLYVEAYFGAPFPQPGLASQDNYSQAYRLDFPNDVRGPYTSQDPATDTLNFADFFGLSQTSGRNLRPAPNVYAYFDRLFAAY